MVDLPGWAWQVALFAGGGLALGVVLGAVLRRKPSAPAAPARPRSAPADRSTPAPAPATVDIPLDDVASPAPAITGTPQQRLLERLREQNLQLAAQAKSAADHHARQMSERQQEQQAESLRRDRQVEELRQNHSAEFSHLLEVMFEQVDRIQVAHSNQAQALSQELERMRQLAQAVDQGGLADDDTGPDGRSGQERLVMAARDVRQAEFAAARAMESLRQPR
ncbi:hypothetical protein [Ideonella paludis]|uniref:DUF2802 domain-containing protein n=2 Tax=Ideonella paludis TaxID=1233411 RepID=A0ABS5DSE4_9BURK|nr:hypothetical protein [Ideonella paludis]MBQ0934073.1 hypothetical protein [Ideonella paludis]